MTKCVLNFVRSKEVLWTQQLRAINFSRCQESSDDADQHSRQENIAPRIIHLFRQSRNAVEADVSQYSNRGAVKHAVDRESLWIVKRTQKIRLWILRQVKNIADGIPEKHQNHGAHNDAEDLIDAG